VLFLFCFSLERFIELSEEAPPSKPPPAALDDEFGDDDFFAGSELQSQGLRGQESSTSQGLLGLDGPVTPLKVELETYFKLPNLPSRCSGLVENSGACFATTWINCQEVLVCAFIISFIRKAVLSIRKCGDQAQELLGPRELGANCLPT